MNPGLWNTVFHIRGGAMSVVGTPRARSAPSSHELLYDPQVPATDRIGDARRILVYGVTGSGKSTMAGRLAGLTGIPATSVDDITWRPGWVPMPPDEQIARFDELTRAERWILDSAYGTWRGLVLDRADLVVALDYPGWLSLARLLRRTAARLVDGQLVCNGNRETLRNALARDGILAWHVTSFARKRTQMRAWAAAPTGPLVIRLRRPAHARRFLAAEAARRAHCAATPSS
jgi:adenylate kinase family enzyme